MRKRVLTSCICIVAAMLWYSCRQEAVSKLMLSMQQDVQKEAYLTFDDGPSVRTDEILDILKEKQIKATFFVVGKEGRESQNRYRRIVKEGHTLGLHSYSHDYEEIYQSVDAFARDIKKLDAYVYQVTGVRSKYLRFPGGSSNSVAGDIKPYIQWVLDQGYQYYDWNALNEDAVNLSLTAEALNHNILKDVHGQSPLIILMHDLAEAKGTVEALPKLIEELKSRGYVLKGISRETKQMHHVFIKKQYKY